ncbi:hypothetical protein [Kineococcus xinjiangensis]|uniref:hypothetical protein n=1 Tax=Kineococcus xinjiangensis TaxID=512762 RepID=UPI0011B045DF|nr:hypothetical protein [Kineococcus xinjiangensis]
MPVPVPAGVPVGEPVVVAFAPAAGWRAAGGWRRVLALLAAPVLLAGGAAATLIGRGRLDAGLHADLVHAGAWVWLVLMTLGCWSVARIVRPCAGTSGERQVRHGLAAVTTASCALAGLAGIAGGGSFDGGPAATGILVLLVVLCGPGLTVVWGVAAAAVRWRGARPPRA